MDDPNANETNQLKVQVADLTRRLKNAQLTIEAERAVAQNATAQAEYYREEIDRLSYMLRLESAKRFNVETKSMQFTEARKYEENKVIAGELHNQLRMEEVEFWMTKNKKEPLKLQRLRAKLAKLEKEQDSQKKLLQEMTEVDGLNEKLTTAAQLGNLEDCHALLNNGAWVNYVDTAGYLPIHYACANGFHDIVKLCLEFGSDHSSFLTGHSPIVVAASKGRTDMIELLLSFGADLEDKGSGRCPAVISALNNGHYETFAFLLNETAADINAFDANENTALHVAARITDKNQAIQTVLFLLEKGIDTERVNRKGHTALQVALYDENKPVAHALGGTFVNQEVVEEDNPANTLSKTRQSGKTSRKELSQTNNNSASQKVKSAAAQPLNETAKSNTTRELDPQSIQYLPRTLDALPRLPLYNNTAQGSSVKLLRASVGAAARKDAAHSLMHASTAPGPRIAALNAMSQQLSAKSRPAPAVSAQLSGKIQNRKSFDTGFVAPVVRKAGPADTAPAPSTPVNGEYDALAALYSPMTPNNALLEREGSLEGSVLSGESGPAPALDDAALAGMLDSQSVMSAVTFGTMKFETA